MSILTFITFVPIVAAIAIVLGMPIRRTSLAAALLNVLLSFFALFSYDRGAAGFQFVSSAAILPDWDLKYLVGADGLSLLLILLCSIVTFAALWLTPKITHYKNLFYACVLLVSAGALGAFSSLDLFFFYAFHELALIPTFLLIGIWGSGDRYAAAWKITIYLALGSFVLLIGLIGLYQSVPLESRTFDIRVLQAMAAAGELPTQDWVYLFLLFGFGILISLFPFHTWAPVAYASAPTAAAMLHAGVLKKFGLYGLLRIALPLMPEAARQWTELLLVLLLGNILYVGLVTIGQKRLDWMLGYSSVMHMGYIFLGIAALNPVALSGAGLLMFAHGLSIAALFAIAGQIRQRTETLEFSALGGLAQPLPLLGLMFGLAAFASIGLPGFANFGGELLVFFGAFGAGGQPWNFLHVATAVAIWGVVITAVYMLRAYRFVFMGELNPKLPKMFDVSRPLRWPIALLLAMLLWSGFYPQYFLNFLTPAVQFLAAR